MYYITTPFGDNRALVSFAEPQKPYFTVDELPEGDGMLVVENGKLKRQVVIIPHPENPFESIAEQNASLTAQLAQLDDAMIAMHESKLKSKKSILSKKKLKK